MFYYLQLIQPELLSIAKGTAQLGINQENFYKLKIQVPSLERQKEIVEYCEYNDTSEPIDEVQNEIVSVEEEVIIEPKPKVKKIVKKVKKPLVIVEEDNEV